MTVAEQIELLKQLRQNTHTRTSGEQAEVDREVVEIDASIEDYNEQIAALEAKLADPNNYKYVSPNAEERDMTLELLEESFIDQLQTLEREDREYKSLQDLGTRIFTSYVEDIATLTVEIESLERRLRKNDVAVSRNMRMQLSPEELNDLTTELEKKRAKLAECKKFEAQYIDELKDYGDLITANNRKREIIIAKQAKLETLKQSRVANASEIDKHKMRLDQDELSRLRAGVAALQARKESITYNAADKIDLLIADLEKGASKEDQVEVAPVEEEQEITPLVGMDYTIDSVEEETKDNPDLIPVAPIVIETGDPIEDEEPDYEAALTEPSDLDEDREAVVEDSNEELLEKRKWPKVKEFLKKHKAKFIAAGLALVVLLAAKGCSNTKDLTPDDLATEPSYTQTYEEDDEKDQADEKEDEKEQTEDQGTGETDETEKEEDKTVETEPDPEVEKNEDLEKEETSEPEIEPETQPETQPETEPETQPETEPDVEPEKDNQEVVEETVELAPGEEIADVSDILEGERIEHGDEIGTKLDSGVEVKDYTEEGNAVVELPTEGEVSVEPPAESEAAVVEDTEDKTFHETLEDFFGGPISITDGENAYENGEEMTPGRQR